MSMRPRSTLSVLVRCHWLVCAIPADAVTRLVLPEDVRVSGGGPGEPMVVVAGGKTWAGWDLGELLELGRQSAAWVLIELPTGPHSLPMALRTGTCLRVQELVAGLTLPPSLFRARHAAFAGGFSVAEAAGEFVEDHGVLGVMLDPTRLWLQSEVEAARALLARSEEAVRL